MEKQEKKMVRPVKNQNQKKEGEKKDLVETKAAREQISSIIDISSNNNQRKLNDHMQQQPQQLK